jgi:hypothetical protein
MELKDFILRDGLVYFRSRLMVPFDNDIRDEIVGHFHDSPMAGHRGKRPTYYLVSQHYYWPIVRSQAKDSRKAKVEQGEFDGELSEQEGRLPL